jgi:hypothetical protein
VCGPAPSPAQNVVSPVGGTERGEPPHGVCAATSAAWEHEVAPVLLNAGGTRSSAATGDQ